MIHGKWSVGHEDSLHMWSLKPKSLKVAKSDFFRKGLHLLPLNWGNYISLIMCIQPCLSGMVQKYSAQSPIPHYTTHNIKKTLAISTVANRQILHSICNGKGIGKKSGSIFCINFEMIVEESKMAVVGMIPGETESSNPKWLCYSELASECRNL